VESTETGIVTRAGFSVASDIKGKNKLKTFREIYNTK